MVKLMILVGSVRPARIGLSIGEWARDAAYGDSRFEVDFCDLKELGLPLMDEPNHPRLHQYTHQHTLEWSERVSEADAFILVSPEYNYSYAPALKNAVDYLFAEWSRKPVAFISYGGPSSGSRGVVAMRPVMAATGMVATMTNVELTLVRQYLSDGRFVPTDEHNLALRGVLSELAMLAPHLDTLRHLEADRSA